MIKSFAFFVLLIALPAGASAQLRMSNSIQIKHITADFPIADLGNKTWNSAKEIEVGTYWSGQKAPVGRHFKARLLWSATALYVRFESNRAEPLIVSEKPDLTRKTLNLWDRDVCEIFIAPDAAKPNKYYEFEVAPTGEWVDVRIEVLPDKRLSDWEYASEMKSAVRIETDRVVSAMRIEWKALGKTPKTGDEWLGNLFRCVGKDPTRGYLAWQPTMTKDPAFHVPSKFGKFVFVQ
jgi:Carbohydrate family 9 binding domain-like